MRLIVFRQLMKHGFPVDAERSETVPAPADCTEPRTGIEGAWQPVAEVPTTSQRQAKPPVQPRRIGSYKHGGTGIQPCRDFCHGLTHTNSFSSVSGWLITCETTYCNLLTGQKYPNRGLAGCLMFRLDVSFNYEANLPVETNTSLGGGRTRRRGRQMNSFEKLPPLARLYWLLVVLSGPCLPLGLHFTWYPASRPP